MGVVRMTGAKTNAQMGEAEKHPRGAVTRQAVHLRRRRPGGGLAAQALHPSRRRTSEPPPAGALDMRAQRSVRWPSALGRGPALALGEGGPAMRAPAGARPLI